MREGDSREPTSLRSPTSNAHRDKRGGFLRNPNKLPLAPPLRGGFLRNPNKLPLAPCSNLFRILLSQASLDEVGERDFFVIPKSATGILAILLHPSSLKQAWTHPFVKVLRREGDSNPRNPFGVYTLSRRASSTTRASLLCVSN